MQHSQLPLNISSQDTIDLLKDFLPQIQQEIREQCQTQLQEQYQTKLQQQLQMIQKQAEQEYQEALDTLENQFRQLKSQKQHSLEVQLVHLQHAHSQKQRSRLAMAQQKYLQEHFDDKILTHPSLAQIQQQLQIEVAQQLMAKFESIRQKKIKELRVRIQGRQQKQRQELDKAIRGQVYAQSGLEQLKNDVNQFRISLASMKSKYNLRVTKLTKECQQLEEKCKRVGHQNSDLMISQIQTQLASLKQTISKEKEQEQQESLDEDARPNYFMPFSGNNNFQFRKGAVQGAHFINQDIDMNSEDSLDKPSQNSSRFQQQLPPPPRQLTQMLSDSPSQDQPQEEIYLQIPQRPLFKFDVAKMLRQQWKQDAFDRYLSSRNKQNQSSLQNQTQNNFQTLYAQHLRKLNMGMKLPTRRLSNRAKQHIMSGLAAHQREMSYID